MLVGPTRAWLLAAALCEVFVAPGCSPATITPGDGGPSSTGPPAICPATFAQVASATCSVEGQSCTYLAPCATFPSNAVCVCSGGSFGCTGLGDAGTSCPVLSTTQPCPMTEKSASGLFCSDLGLICTYPSACPGIPTFDSCQCVGGRTADEQTHFECSRSCVILGDAAAQSPAGSPPDATTAPDAQLDDAQPNAPAEAAPSPDGATGDP
jgi:hypothetical protein